MSVYVCFYDPDKDGLFMFLAWLCLSCRTGTLFRHWEKEPMESMNPPLSLQHLFIMFS